MTSITIITIVVVVLLTFIIFGLSWIAYVSCLKMYQTEVNQGKHDEEIEKEYYFKKKHKEGLLTLICSCVILVSLLSLFVTGIVYRANNQNFSIDNETALVIKSDSMSDFYDEEIASEYNYDRSLQFDIGDICFFENISSEEEFIIGDVYGYQYKDIIITHRLVSITDNMCKFRGDNNKMYDGLVSKEKVIYHYTGNKIVALGSFVLYAQSYFGIWSLLCIIGIFVSSEIVYFKIVKISKKRLADLGVKL